MSTTSSPSDRKLLGGDCSNKNRTDNTRQAIYLCRPRVGFSVLLFTTERTSTRRQFEQAIRHYEHRWLIEEYHKCRKTGCRIEQRRFQSVDNLERIMAVTSHIAVRLLTLRALSRLDPEKPCTVAFSETQWRCLFAKMEPDRSAPKRPPTVAWAFSALAKFAGWRDTKRTGRVGWQTLWRGCAKLDGLVEGWNLAQGSY